MKEKLSNISNKQVAYWYIYSAAESVSFAFLGLLLCTSLALGKLAFSRKPFLYPFGSFWASAPEIQLCTACLPSNGCVSPSPLMTPSSPNTKPSPLPGRCCHPNPGTSGWSSVGRPRPEPSRRHMTWETRMKHTAHRKTHCFLCLSLLPLPLWHHPHQTPSLCPFRADVVPTQMQVGQGGVLFQGLGQSLARDTWLERRVWSTQYRKVAKTSL